MVRVTTIMESSADLHLWVQGIFILLRGHYFMISLEQPSWDGNHFLLLTERAPCRLSHGISLTPCYSRSWFVLWTQLKLHCTFTVYILCKFAGQVYSISNRPCGWDVGRTREEFCWKNTFEKNLQVSYQHPIPSVLSSSKP